MSKADDAQWVIETDEETFEKDVFEQSKTTPVVVDFWAAWCQPCRMLAPVLEQLAREYEGRFLLVKADTDRVPKAANEFNVQGIPAVYGVCGGEVVDFFNGALPPDQVRRWIDGVLLSGESISARRLEQSDAAAAEQLYRDILDRQPDNPTAATGLARVLLAQQQLEEARELIQQVEQRHGFLDDEGERVKAALALDNLSDIDSEQARTAAAADPNNLQLQLKLAEALAGNRQFQEAMDTCLAVVQKDKAGAGDQARQIMVDIFRVLPDEDLVREYRRKLSTALY